MTIRYSTKGWLIVAGVVAAIEIGAPPGELLSQGAARYKKAAPVTTAVVIGGLAAHLYGLIPKRIDPLTRIAEAFGR